MAVAAANANSDANKELRGSWEETDGNSDLLEQRLERLKVGSPFSDSSNLNGGDLSSHDVVLDSTREESLRTQYVAPEPKLTILSRPKQNSGNPRNQSHAKLKNKTAAKSKSLQQREEEYAAARMRILGDVKFEAEEAQVAQEATLSPAELLKQKIAEAMKGEPVQTPANKSTVSKNAKKTNGEAAGGSNAQNGPKRSKRSKEKVKTVNLEPVRDFPVHKTESDRIIRHPRGPDGTTGFTNYRS